MSTLASTRVGVIGAGAWGTALAIVANRAGSITTLATRNLNVVEAIEERRCNDIYLPGISMDPAIRVSEKFTDACRTDVLVLASPSHCLRSVAISISDTLEPHIPIVIASKGIERGSLLLMSEVVSSILPRNPIGVISGPNFAEETARGMPTATTIACAPELWDLLSYAIGGRLFRPYHSIDIVGAQIGGAVKNVIAIACGIACGQLLGENARAALVTRGFAEIARLTIAKGGSYETLMGLSGLGDLILTCGSTKSRNFSFGMSIGQGRGREEILASRGRSATEGVVAAESVVKLARKHDVEMPICDAVHRILFEDAEVRSVIESLLSRPFSNEFA